MKAKLSSTSRRILGVFFEFDKATMDSKPLDTVSPAPAGRREPIERTTECPPIYFSFNLEKISGKGEDSDPILAFWREPGFCESGLVAVFDGLGGAGSTKYVENDANVTGAYLASRLARKTVDDYFSGPDRPREDFEIDSVTSDLKQRLTRALADKAREFSGESKLRSKLIKRLPTTMSAIYYRVLSSGTLRERASCAVVWAGDSRCYCLHSDQGLQQLTTDDIKSEGDALDNLRNDAPLSNYINADTDFNLNSAVYSVNLPVVLLAATDGCFGYIFTPAHFEHLLLDTLLQSADEEQWKRRIMGFLRETSGDDASLALVALGWSDFAAVKRSLAPRLEALTRAYIAPLDTLSSEIEAQDKRLEEAEKLKRDCELRRAELRAELWTKYKRSYDGLRISLQQGLKRGEDRSALPSVSTDSDRNKAEI